MKHVGPLLLLIVVVSPCLEVLCIPEDGSGEPCAVYSGAFDAVDGSARARHVGCRLGAVHSDDTLEQDNHHELGALAHAHWH